MRVGQTPEATFALIGIKSCQRVNTVLAGRRGGRTGRRRCGRRGSGTRRRCAGGCRACRTNNQSTIALAFRSGTLPLARISDRALLGCQVAKALAIFAARTNRRCRRGSGGRRCSTKAGRLHHANIVHWIRRHTAEAR